MSTTSVGVISGEAVLTDNWSSVLTTITGKTEAAVRTIKSSTKELKEWGGNLKSIAGGLAPVSLAITGIGVASLSMARDLNASMANVSTLIDAKALPKLGEMRETVQGLAVDMGKSTGDMADGLYEIISTLGYSADSMKILEINAKAGAAGLATTQEAIKFTSAVTKSFGDTSAEAFQKVSDLGFQTVNLGQTTFPELASAIGGVAPIAAETGIQLEEMFGIIATATGVTGSTSEVVTQMTSAITALISPSKEMALAYEQMGVSSGSALIKQHGLAGSLQMVAKHAKTTGVELIDLVGRKEAWILTSSLAGNQADTLTEKMKAMGGVAGVTDEAFKRQTQGINASGFAWEQFKVKVQVASENLGNVLLPVLGKVGTAMLPVVDWATKAIEVYGKLPVPVQATGIAIAGMLAAAAPAAYVLGSMAQAFSALLPYMTATTLGYVVMAAKISLVTGALITAIAGIKEITGVYGKFQETWAKGGKDWEQNIPGFTDDWIRKLTGWGQAAKKAEVAQISLTDQIKNSVTETQKAAEAAAKDAEAKRLAAINATNYSGELKKVQEQVKGLTSAQRTDIDAAMKMGVAQADIAKKYKVSEAAIRLYSEQKKVNTKIIKDNTKELEKNRKEQDEAIRQYRNEVGERLIQDEERKQEAIREQAAAMRAYNNEVGTRIIENAALAQQSEKDRLAALREYNNELGIRRMEDDAALMARQDVKGNISKNLGKAFNNIPQMLIEAFTGGGGAKGAFQAIGVMMAQSITEPIMANLSKLGQRSVNGGAAMAGAVGGMFGGSTGAMIGSTAAALGGAAVAATAWGTSMAAAGVAGSMALAATTMGIGLAAVGVYMLAKKWAGVSKEVKEVRKETRAFEDELHKTLTGIQQLEAQGKAWAATVIAVRDSYIGMGMGAEEATAKADAMVKALWDDKNPERARAAMQELNAVTGAWQFRITESNKELSKTLGMASDLGIRLPQAIIDTISKLGEMGLVTQDNIDLLKELAGTAEVDWKKMEEAAGRYGINTEALGTTFQGLRIGDSAKAIINDFDLLTRGGASVGTVLHGMREEISKVVQESIKFGTSIPENMKPWVTELQRTGQLTDENGQALKDLSGINFGDPILTAFEKITGQLQEIIDKLVGGGGLKDALNSIPKDVDVNVNVNTGYNPDRGNRGDGDYTDPGYASGTMGRHSRWFRDFKQGTKTELHGEEAVIRKDQAGAFANDMLMNNRTEGSEGGPVQIVLVARDGGRVLADVVVENMSNSLRRVGLAN